MLKKESTKFSSKLDEHKNNLSSITTSFDKHLKKMIVNNRVGRNIEAATSELEAEI